MIQALIPLLGPALDRLVNLIPNPDTAATAKAEAMQQILAAVQQQDTQQVEVNTVEAASTNWFVAGWRPFIGWVCGAALAYTYVVYPLLNGVVSLYGRTLPAVPTDALFELVVAMLGLGGLRTFEKLRGATR